MGTYVPRSPRVVLRKPRTTAGVLLLAKAVYAALVANKAMFPTPNPPLATFLGHIEALDDAQTSTLTRTTGTTAVRNTARGVVELDLEHVAAYVQTVIDASPAQAADIASAAGLALHKSTAYARRAFTVKNDPKERGALIATASTGGVRGSHDWQFSTDGGTTWTSVASTLRATTRITGLVPATRVFVRHRMITRKGPLPWSEPVSVIVA